VLSADDGTCENTIEPTLCAFVQPVDCVGDLSVAASLECRMSAAASTDCYASDSFIVCISAPWF
jgi:hypothetical protein